MPAPRIDSFIVQGRLSLLKYALGGGGQRVGWQSV